MNLLKSKIDKISLKKERGDFLRAKITSSRDAFDYIKQFYFEDIEIYESFFLLMLNRANNTIGYVKISQGGTSSTIVDVKLIAKYCVESLCCSALIAHNHPSGNRLPSDNDRQITDKVKSALKIFDISVLDHLILIPNQDGGEFCTSFYSFADEGIL